MRNFVLVFIFSLIVNMPVYADVYPFEEEYSEPSSSVADLGEEDAMVTDKSEPVEVVTDYDEISAPAAGRTQMNPYNQITYKNFGTVMINLAKGVGNLYKGLFTEAFPSYGSDLVSLPAVTAELSRQMIEIERKALFEADAKQKEIDAYREKMQRPLTPEEQATLEKLQAKQ